MPAPGSRITTAILLCSTLLLGACSSGGDEPATSSAAESDGDTGDSTDDGSTDDGSEASSTPATASDLYGDPGNWLCRPDVADDACDVDLDATLVAADGAMTIEPFEAAVDAPADCFYVYPTISTDPGSNSDLVADDAERGIAANQAARFGEVCNVYAPMYRQTPLGAMFDRLEGDAPTTTLAPDDPSNPRFIAYSDVRDSFLHYLAEDNGGRPFVLVGHSQGAGHLAALIAAEIDTDEERRAQMLSAMLIGGSVTVEGDDTFDNVQPCTTAADTGCVISYASFYADEPPPPDSLFGRSRSGDGRALCSNPGDLSNSGPAPLDSYFQAGHAEGAPEVPTPWIHYDGLVTGECLSDADFDWLSLDNTATTGSPLPADLGGRLTPAWGTHLADINFAVGDLVELVRSQSNQS